MQKSLNLKEQVVTMTYKPIASIRKRAGQLKTKARILYRNGNGFIQNRIINFFRYGINKTDYNAINQVADGSLAISMNRRFLMKPDGTPFLWLGDTAWELIHKLNREDATHYLINRSQKGFTIIQTVILAELNGLTTPNAYGHVPLLSDDPLMPNELYFEHVDWIVDEAAKNGLYVGLLPTWGDKVTSKNGGEPVIFDEHNAFSFGKFLGTRYRNKKIVWILGGDRNTNNKTEIAVWTSMANGIKSGDEGRHLITYHPKGGATSQNMLTNQFILDFNMYQSGHHKQFNSVYNFAHQLWNSWPKKPFVDGEPAYEDIPVNFGAYLDWNSIERVPVNILNPDNTIADKSFFEKGFFTDYDIRIHAYWNFLSGACGYSYGANAIWQMFEKNGTFAIPCVTDWREALDLEGANDVIHIKNILQLYPFQKLKPSQSIIAQKNPKNRNHIRAAQAEDNSYILVYLALGQPVVLNLGNTEYQSKWYDPRNGEFISISGPFKNKQKFIPPTTGINHDWLLVIQRKISVNTKYSC